MQDEPESHLCTEAEAALNAGDFSRARELTDEALSHRPDWVEARMLRAYALQDDPKAMEDLDWVLEREPKNYNALRLRAHFRATSDDLEGAMADLEVLYRLEPDNYDTLSKAADTLIRLGRYDEALGYAKAMEEIEPDGVLTYAYMGEALLLLGYFEAALAWLMPVSHEAEAGPYYGLRAAQALCRLRQYEVAGNVMDECATQDATLLDDHDWLDLAEIRLELGQVQAAFECLERARESEQKGAWLALWGRAQIASGCQAAGLDALDRALRSFKSEQENTASAKDYNIAWCHASRGVLARQYGIHLIDIQAERAAACAALIRACARSDVSLRYARSDPCFDALWSMPELESLAAEGGREV